MNTPLLAVTMGDPSGIGPETIVGAWSEPSVHASCRPFVVGQAGILRRSVELCRKSIDVVEISSPEEAAPSPALLPCLNAVASSAQEALPGKIDARGGQAAYDALTCAAELALARRVDGIVTAPLQKAALHEAGHHYPGHTELLAELCGVDDFAMMLYLASREMKPEGPPDDSALGGLGVVHVTLHMALRDVFAALSTTEILAKTRSVACAMQRLSGRPPRVGVCALNPHAGESGLFGDEEQTIIRPAVELATAEGIDSAGPFPADSLFRQALAGEFDALVAMYHDQGHIALKLAGFHRAVNVTLGLPIIRTSVAHGTAMDIAWQGRADSRGMVEAIRVASRLAASRLNGFASDIINPATARAPSPALPCPD